MIKTSLAPPIRDAPVTSATSALSRLREVMRVWHTYSV